jgi:hypothetical protein
MTVQYNKMVAVINADYYYHIQNIFYTIHFLAYSCKAFFSTFECVKKFTVTSEKNRKKNMI